MSHNVKVGIKVSKKELDKVVQYFKDSGWDVQEKGDVTFKTYYAPKCRGYGKLTPVAESVLVGGSTGRMMWNHWIYIRIPMS